MECPNCTHLNPHSAKYCQNCGHSLEAPCPNCGTHNNLAAKFCQNCGHQLVAELKPVADPIEPPKDPAQILSERRIVTILFADVKGSTSIAEQLDPEEWTEIMNGAFERLIPAINRYGGTVARLMGDAVLALFGAPITHEDDPYRAVLASIDMIKDLRPYQDRVREGLVQAGLRPDPTDFEVRIGLNTGLVVVGQVGSGQSTEYTAMGDAVNLAARMEQTAEPGTIQITNDTYRHVNSTVKTESLGELEVKGKSDRLQTFRVLGLKSEIDGWRDESRGAAPLIGRQKEMRILRQSLENLQGGSGQIVCLIGEAGLGKSRLIQELNKEILNHLDLKYYSAVSLSFETSQPYGLLQRLLRTVCEAGQSDSPDLIRSRISTLIRELPEDQQSPMSSVLSSLFSLELENGEQALEGENLKRALFTSMSAFWKIHAAQHPIILVLEDLHWADAASLELIRHLFAVSDTAPILFLCVFRPVHQAPSWLVKNVAESEYAHRYQEITLNPLTDNESDSLVESLLQASDLPKEVRDLILGKAEGNPFFVEEIVWELVDSETVLSSDQGQGWRLAGEIGDMEVPDSLEALLVARIDRLPELSRNVLQLASVIGRSFYYRVLELIATNIDLLDDQMRALQRTGLILEAARIPELEYMFRHVLTQEAAYNTILLRRRRHFHQRTGEIMEQLFVNRIDEHAPLLAHHFSQAGDLDRSLDYLILAGKNAARLHANTEAVDHFSKALAIDERKPLSSEYKITLHRQRGLAYEMMGIFSKALLDFELVLKISRESGRKRDIWLALLDLGKLWASRDYQLTEKYFQQALDIARQLEDPAALGRSLNRVGNWYVNAERPREGIQLHLEAKTIFDDLDHTRGRANSLDLLGMASLLGGDSVAANTYFTGAISLFDELDERAGLVSSITAKAETSPSFTTQSVFPAYTLEEGEVDAYKALEMSRDIGWRAGESFACWSLAQILGVGGSYEVAFKAAKDALDIAVEIDHFQWKSGAYGTLGFLYLDLLDAEKAIEMLEPALAIAQQVDSQNFISSSAGSLASAYVLSGDLKRAHGCLDPLLDSDTPMISIGQRLMWIAKAELTLAEGAHSAALQIIDDLITSASSRPQDGVISKLWHLRASILLASGDYNAAENVLLAAVNNAVNFGETTLLWKLYGTLGHVYGRLSLQEDSKRAMLKAREIVNELRRTLPDRTMRDEFLHRAGDYLEEA